MGQFKILLLPRKIQKLTVKQTSTFMKKEHLGAFIDAIYAVGITMLAMDLPNHLHLESSQTFELVKSLHLQYCLAFFMLFSLWFQHRGINEHILNLSFPIVSISTLILLIVPLIPCMVKIAYQYGYQPGNILNFNISEKVDLIFISCILIVNLLLDLLSSEICMPKNNVIEYKQFQQIKKNKPIITGLITLIFLIILIIPNANSNLLWIVVFFLFFGYIGKIQNYSAE
jgi:uncharacterized membrane protein